VAKVMRAEFPVPLYYDTAPPVKRFLAFLRVVFPLPSPLRARELPSFEKSWTAQPEMRYHISEARIPPLSNSPESISFRSILTVMDYSTGFFSCDVVCASIYLPVTRHIVYTTTVGISWLAMQVTLLLISSYYTQ